MRKKIILLILSAALVVAMALPALACTPPLNPPSSPHIEFNWTPSEEFEAGIKYGVDQYLKEHPLDITLPETETETETNSGYHLWSNFSWRNGKWFNFLR